MDTYARRVVVDLTGRTRWADGRGPAGFSGRDHMDLFAALLFTPREVFTQELIPIERRSLKERIGMDPNRRFFAPSELMLNDELHRISGEFRAKKQRDSAYRPLPDEQEAMDTEQRMSAMAFFVTGQGLAIVPTAGTDSYATVGTNVADHAAEDVQAALLSMRDAYVSTEDMLAPTESLIASIESRSAPEPSLARKIDLELLYNRHNPWRMSAIATVLALLLLSARWLVRSRILTALVALAIAWAIAEQAFGLGLRVLILGRAPVSNTYEALLWMGLVSVAIGLVGQVVRPKSWYLAAGLGASLLAVLFSMLVPLGDRTNALPAVLRSNYWLIIHVLTIVASYAALLLAAVLAHVYLARDVLLRRPSAQSDRVIVQVYRVIQVGVFLLTAGTILGGVWAADSWGRFWGWDPKETWSLISIIVYFALLHARYVGWIGDFGLAVAAIVGFLAIVWTFYGVNYVMATGLHSYGFGSGGERWVALWALAEVTFVGLCFLRRRSEDTRASELASDSEPKAVDGLQHA